MLLRFENIERNADYNPRTDEELKARRAAAQEAAGRFSLRKTFALGTALAVGITGVATLGPRLASTIHEAAATTNLTFKPNSATTVSSEVGKVDIPAGVNFRHDNRIVESRQEGSNSCAQLNHDIETGHSRYTTAETTREWVALPIDRLADEAPEVARACDSDRDGLIWVARSEVGIH